MYLTVPKKRRRLIRSSGDIILDLPESRFMRYCSRPFDVLYSCKKEHGASFKLFKADAIAADGMLMFTEIRFAKDSEQYPPGVLDELCKMAMDEFEMFSILGGFDILMVSSEIPFFPEIWLERKYDIEKDEYAISKNGWRATKEFWEESQ